MENNYCKKFLENTRTRNKEHSLFISQLIEIHWFKNFTHKLQLIIKQHILIFDTF